jgi:proteasome accessory factor C
MPKLKNVLSGDDQFNFLISLIGLINTEGEISIDDAATRLGMTREAIRSAMSTIVVAGHYRSDGGEVNPYNFNWGAFEQDDILCWDNSDVFLGAPKISVRQAAAIAAGLSFLRSLPEFASERDLDGLVELLKTAQPNASAPTIRFEFGSVSADIEILRKAILTTRRITCNYTNQRGEESDRELDPIRLDPHGAVWYLRAWCPKSQELRAFRLDRMRAVAITDAGRSEQAELEAARVDELDDRVYIPDEHDTEVLIEVDPEAYELAAEFATTGGPKVSADGTLRVTIKVGYLPNLGHLIAKYGGAARVIEPAEARQIVKDYCLQSLGEAITKPQHEVSED